MKVHIRDRAGTYCGRGNVTEAVASLARATCEPCKRLRNAELIRQDTAVRQDAICQFAEQIVASMTAAERADYREGKLATRIAGLPWQGWSYHDSEDNEEDGPLMQEVLAAVRKEMARLKKKEKSK
jgi:hypothetical protein